MTPRMRLGSAFRGDERDDPVLIWLLSIVMGIVAGLVWVGLGRVL